MGILADLPGNWSGTGFNIIAVPTTTGGFRLVLNRTKETFSFTATGPVPNRGGLGQADVVNFGVHYLQSVNNVQPGPGGKVVESPIHVEAGMFLNVPKSAHPDLGTNIVRISTIPHGDALMAQSTLAETVQGGPIIQPVDSTPVAAITGPTLLTTRLGYLEPYEESALPAPIPGQPDITQQMVQNPNLLLEEAIAGQNIVQTAVFRVTTVNDDPSEIATPFSGAVVNTPFVQTNANAVKMNAIFWIEEVVESNGRKFLQLQYTQTVTLRFLNIDWPHISVATLRKEVGQHCHH